MYLFSFVEILESCRKEVKRSRHFTGEERASTVHITRRAAIPDIEQSWELDANLIEEMW